MGVLLTPNMNTFKVIAASAFASLSVLSINPVQAAPAWTNFLAREACSNVRMGMSARKAGQEAAKAILRSKHAGTFFTVFESGNWEKPFRKALLETCPSDLLKAARASR